MLDLMFGPDEIAPETIRRLSRREYDQMVAAGIFDEDERIELLEGMLVTMSPQGEPHARVIEWLTQRMIVWLGFDFRVRCQLPYAASESSEPEPDLAIFRGDHRTDDHPSEALLIVEVSDSSIRKDRILKQRVYAKAGLPEYWIVNVQAKTVEVYTQPRGDAFISHQVFRVGDVLRPTRLPNIEVPVADLPF